MSLICSKMRNCLRIGNNYYFKTCINFHQSGIAEFRVLEGSYAFKMPKASSSVDKWDDAYALSQIYSHAPAAVTVILCADPEWRHNGCTNYKYVSSHLGIVSSSVNHMPYKDNKQTQGSFFRKRYIYSYKHICTRFIFWGKYIIE